MINRCKMVRTDPKLSEIVRNDPKLVAMTQKLVQIAHTNRR